MMIKVDKVKIKTTITIIRNSKNVYCKTTVHIPTILYI